MIKTLRNITDTTLSINLFGHLYDIPVGWSLSADELWGGEETLRYVAVKFAGQVKVFDETGEEVDIVECPGCKSGVLTKIGEIQESEKEIPKKDKKSKGQKSK